MPPEAVVFLGPSLAIERARQILYAEFRPPVCRGDLDRLLDNPPRLVGLVDGEFFQSLSVSPKEVVRLLERGVTVMGASSMGALRAVETSAYGAVGIGRIFRLFRAGEIDGDDEVAVTYCRETNRTLSEPLVCIRIALGDARRAGILNSRQSSLLVRRMKAVYFPERRMPRFWMEAERILPNDTAVALRRFFVETQPDAKADDAIALLREMARRVSGAAAG